MLCLAAAAFAGRAELTTASGFASALANLLRSGKSEYARGFERGDNFLNGDLRGSEMGISRGRTAAGAFALNKLRGSCRRCGAVAAISKDDLNPSLPETAIRFALRIMR